MPYVKNNSENKLYYNDSDNTLLQIDLKYGL